MLNSEFSNTTNDRLKRRAELDLEVHKKSREFEVERETLQRKLLLAMLEDVNASMHYVELIKSNNFTVQTSSTYRIYDEIQSRKIGSPHGNQSAVHMSTCYTSLR